MHGLKAAAVENQDLQTAALPVPEHPKEPTSALYDEDRRGAWLYVVLAGS